MIHTCKELENKIYIIEKAGNMGYCLVRKYTGKILLMGLKYCHLCGARLEVEDK